MDDNQQKDSRWHNRTGKESGKSPADDLGEWIQDMIQDAVDSMDFSGLAQNIRDAVSSAKNEMGGTGKEEDIFSYKGQAGAGTLWKKSV